MKQQSLKTNLNSEGTICFTVCPRVRVCVCVCAPWIQRLPLGYIGLLLYSAGGTGVPAEGCGFW